MTQISPTALEEAARGLCKSMHGNCNNAGYISDYYTQHATAAITAYLAQAGKESWVMVPKIILDAQATSTTPVLAEFIDARSSAERGGE